MTAAPGTPDKREMRIAYVINSVEGGGAALPVPAIAGALRACGAELRLFALTRRDARALPGLTAAGLDPAVRDGGERDHLAAAAWLARSVKMYRPDIVWTSLTRATLLGQLVGARLGVPVVSWQHAAFLKPANLRLLRATRGLTALWLADSQAVAEFTVAKLGVPAKRLAAWPLFAADPAAIQAAPWRPGENIRIGSLGRLHPVKGYDLLIAALGLIRANGMDRGQRWEVVIAGEGSERERLEAAIERAGLVTVSLSGFTEDPDEFLAAQHLYVQPSRSEGFCVAAHQAMQAGLPVVASRVGELAKTIVPGVTGALVPPGDPAALAAALASCIAAPGTLRRMGSASRMRVLDRFSPDQFQANARAIYRRVAELCR